MFAGLTSGGRLGGAGVKKPRHKRIIGVTIDGGGSTPATGYYGPVLVPFSGTIIGWRLAADVSGSAVIDVWKIAFGQTAPAVGNTITAASLPTLSSQVSNKDDALLNWTRSVEEGDLIGFNLNSASTLTRIVIELLILPKMN